MSAAAASSKKSTPESKKESKKEEEEESGGGKDAFIDVQLATASVSAATAVLHDFSSCAFKFSGILPGGGGLVYSVTSSAPTLVVSASGYLGTTLRDYVAVNLYVVPKLHASNKLDQVSASDIEIILEHAPSAAASAAADADAAARYFLCAVVSPSDKPEEDVAVAPDTLAPAAAPAAAAAPAPAPAPAAAKLVGADAALLRFLTAIDAGATTSAEIKANNAKLLPVDTPLTFPGIDTCMAYPDAKGNVVLLASAPMLVPGAIVARLHALVGAAAPVFRNFDLAPKPGAAVDLVALRDNNNYDADADAKPAADADEDDDEAGASRRSEEGFRAAPELPSRANDIFAFVVAVIALAVLVVLPVWIYAPTVYAYAVTASSAAVSATDSVLRAEPAVLLGSLCTAAAVAAACPASVRSVVFGVLFVVLLFSSMVAAHYSALFLGGGLADLDRGILRTKGFLASAALLATVLITSGAAAAVWPAVVAGAVLATLLAVFVVSIFADLRNPRGGAVAALSTNFSVSADSLTHIFKIHY